MLFGFVVLTFIALVTLFARKRTTSQHFVVYSGGAESRPMSRHDAVSYQKIFGGKVRRYRG